jgi:hypothetical protein
MDLIINDVIKNTSYSYSPFDTDNKNNDNCNSFGNNKEIDIDLLQTKYFYINIDNFFVYTVTIYVKVYYKHTILTNKFLFIYNISTFEYILGSNDSITIDNAFIIARDNVALEIVKFLCKKYQDKHIGYFDADNDK